MIEELLPECVVVREAFDDSVPATLFPEEEVALGAAVAQRRREFTTARRCAREGLAALGFPPLPVPTGPNREPCWPDGVVGSITHCLGYRAAAVAHREEVASVGIDAEPAGPLPDGVLDMIALPEERRQVADLAAADPSVPWERLLFCAKESVYKVWFPLARRWLDFHEAAVTVYPDRGTFSARLLVSGPVLPDGTKLDRLDGRWLVRDGLVLAAIALPLG